MINQKNLYFYVQYQPYSKMQHNMEDNKKFPNKPQTVQKVANTWQQRARKLIYTKDKHTIS